VVFYFVPEAKYTLKTKLFGCKFGCKRLRTDLQPT
jgi:hypothetical protein